MTPDWRPHCGRTDQWLSTGTCQCGFKRPNQLARPALSDETLREMAKDWAGRLQIIGEIDPVIAFARAVLASQQEQR